MAKFEYTVTQKSIERKIAEGRCQNDGSDYEPWKKVHEVPSRGRSHIVYHTKYERECHLLSDGEYNLWLYLTFSPQVIDVREQYALSPQTETLAIAKHLNISHPKHPKTKHPIMMTTDFLVTVKTGLGTNFLAISYKSSKELNKKRVLEKLEIERRFWEKRKISWQIVTEKEIDKNIIRNIKKFISYVSLDDNKIIVNNLYAIRDSLTDYVLQEEKPLREILRACDHEYNSDAGTAQRVVLHLLATGYWQIDLYQALNNSKILRLKNRAELEE